MTTLSIGIGSTAFALATACPEGHCEDQASLVHNAKIVMTGDVNLPEIGSDFGSTESGHKSCAMHACSALAEFVSQPDVVTAHFDVFVTGFENNLHPLQHVDNLDRPPNV